MINAQVLTAQYFQTVNRILELVDKALHPACEELGRGHCQYRGTAQRIGSYNNELAAEDKKPRTADEQETYLADLKQQLLNGKITKNYYDLRASVVNQAKDDWENAIGDRFIASWNGEDVWSGGIDELTQLREEAITLRSEWQEEIEAEIVNIANREFEQNWGTPPAIPYTLDEIISTTNPRTKDEINAEGEQLAKIYKTQKQAREAYQWDMQHWQKAGESSEISREPVWTKLTNVKGNAYDKVVKWAQGHHSYHVNDWIDAHPKPQLKDYLDKVDR